MNSSFTYNNSNLTLPAQKNEEPMVMRHPDAKARLDVLGSTRLYHRICILTILIVVSSASFSAFYEKWHFREQGTRGFDPGVEFRQMIDGSARRPYIYRQLLPATANWLAETLPIPKISARLPERVKERVSAAFDLGAKAYPIQYLIVYIATYLFALMASFALYRVCTATGLSPPTALFTAVLFMLVFPLIGVKGGYFFDYPELFFMALAAWMALRLDWGWIIPIAALGAWNKESFLLFMFTLYPLLRRRASRLNSLVGVAVLVAICAAVYVPIRLHFAHNPGGTVEWHLGDQVFFFLHPFQIDTWIDRSYGLMFPAMSSPIPMAFLAWTVWRKWSFLPTWLKRHAQIAAVINIPLFLLFCQPGEFRDLSLLFITFLLIIALNLQEWIESFHAKRSESAA